MLDRALFDLQIPLRKERILTRRLHSGEGRYRIYNSPIRSYEKSFEDVLHGQAIADLLPQRQPVVVDVMAPSGTLASLFSQRQFDDPFGLAITLTDLRSDADRERDRTLHITQLTGDITTSQVWKDAANSLGGRKAYLIIERAVVGILNLPVHPLFYANILQKMWHMLDTQGTLLLQLPYSAIRSINIEKLLATFNHHDVRTTFDLDRHIRIQRHTHSPVHLPLSSDLIKVS